MHPWLLYDFFYFAAERGARPGLRRGVDSLYKKCAPARSPETHAMAAQYDEEDARGLVSERPCPPGFVDRLYATVRVPAALCMVLVYAVGLAELETSATLAQRIVFAALAGSSLLVLLLLASLRLARFWNRFRAASGADECVSMLRNSVWPMVDFFLALCIAWGLGAFAFYLFDATGFYATEEHPPSRVRWVAALEFVASMTNDVVTSNVFFEPIHWATRLYEFPLAVFHYFYSLLMLGAGAATVYDSMKDAWRRRKAARKGLLDREPSSSNNDGAATPARRPIPTAASSYVLPLVRNDIEFTL